MKYISMKIKHNSLKSKFLKLNHDLFFHKVGDNLPCNTGDNVTVESGLLFNIPTSRVPIPSSIYLSRVKKLNQIHI